MVPPVSAVPQAPASHCQQPQHQQWLLQQQAASILMQQSQASHTPTESQALVADTAQIKWAKAEAMELAVPKKDEPKVVLLEVV
jgi:UDP-3-O-[3-hydroxymyristoyl] glucosamine N-acyltransferase